MVDQCQLLEVFKYKEGRIYWKSAHFPSLNGTEAGGLSGGRRVVRVNGKNYLIHRVIWIMHNGPIPDGVQIDHKDRNKLNNRIENLRMATGSQNACNIGKRSHNKTGYKGVSYVKLSGKYLSSVAVNGVQKNLGYYDTAKEAYEVYQMAATMLHGEYVNFD